jgi:hypothetical protein
MCCIIYGITRNGRIGPLPFKHGLSKAVPGEFYEIVGLPGFNSGNTLNGGEEQ